MFSQSVITRFLLFCLWWAYVCAAHANTNTHKIMTVLVVPSDADKTNLAKKQNDLLLASQIVQQQWASWGLSFNLVPRVGIVHSNRPTADFDGKQARDMMIQTLKNSGWMAKNTKYNLFIEGANYPGASAHGGEHIASYYGRVTKNLYAQLPKYMSGNSDENYPEIGVIGHELGHTFFMPHENCAGKEDFNGNALKKWGLPHEGSLSLMCNHKWPDVTTPESWMISIITSRGGKNWFAEFSGGDGHQKAGSLGLFPLTAEQRQKFLSEQ